MPWTDCSPLLERHRELCCEKEISEKPESSKAVSETKAGRGVAPEPRYFAGLIHGRWPVKTTEYVSRNLAGFEHQKLKSVLRHHILVDVRLRPKPVSHSFLGVPVFKVPISSPTRLGAACHRNLLGVLKRRKCGHINFPTTRASLAPGASLPTLGIPMNTATSV